MGILEVSEFWILSQLLVILSQSQPELEVFLEIILPFVAPFSLLSGSINFSWMGILKTLRIPRAQMLVHLPLLPFRLEFSYCSLSK